MKSFCYSLGFDIGSELTEGKLLSPTVQGLVSYRFTSGLRRYSELQRACSASCGVLSVSFVARSVLTKLGLMSVPDLNCCSAGYWCTAARSFMARNLG